jgi:hypothetical protein
MTDSELTTAPIVTAEAQPATPTEPVAPPIEQVAAPTKVEPTETAEKGVTPGVQKRIDQYASKLYAALDDKKQLEKRVKELEESARPQTTKEVSMFEEPEEVAEKTELTRLQNTVNTMAEQQKKEREMAGFTELFSEMREKYPSLTWEDGIQVVAQLSADDVPPTARGVITTYFAAREAEQLRAKLQEKETKQERKAAVTETKTIAADEHFPDDTMEAIALLKKDPAKYEELAKKAGLRG